MFSGKKKRTKKENAGKKPSKKKKEEDIKNFISILKKQYKDGLISEKTFKETLKKNEEALEQLKSSAVPDEGKTSESKAEERKTVGEILKEEGVIPEEEVRETGKVKVEHVIDIEKVVMNVEKLSAEVEALRDIKFQTDERIKEISESIGEMRSLIFQRDGAIKEMQMKIEKLNDAVSDIKPEKITAEFKKQEKEMLETNAKTEKLESMVKDVARQLKSVQRVLDNIKSIKNLISISREIDRKISKIEKLKADVERDAEKTEKFYLDLEDRIEEFIRLKASVQKLDELTKELVKTVDEEKIKMANFVDKEELQNALDNALKPPSSDDMLEEKIKKKKEIETLLKNIENQYRRGIISKESFDEICRKNNLLVKMLDKEIERAKSKKTPENMIEWIEQLESDIKSMHMKLSILDEVLKSYRGESKEGGENEVGVITREDEKRIKQMLETKLLNNNSQPEQRHDNEYMPKIEEDRITKESNIKNDSDKSINDEINDIKMFLSDLEDKYNMGLISERTFNEAKEKNLMKLLELEKLKSLAENKENYNSLRARLNDIRQIRRNNIENIIQRPNSESELREEFETFRRETEENINIIVDSIKKILSKIE